jgi:opacity protein-like surface antigen
MNLKTSFLSAVSSLFLLSAASAFAQNVEITGHIGGQVNGGTDLATPLFDRLDVENSTNYGVSLGYLLGERGGVEFMWNHTQSDTLAEPIGTTVSNVRVFSLNQNQYMGNFMYHFTDREKKFRPFAFFGLGASNLAPDRANVEGSTNFAWAIGGGAKYNVAKHLGFRGTFRYAPTYLRTTADGYWCDPFWGGCWLVGDSHYLNAFDVSGGVTFRF